MKKYLCFIIGPFVYTAYSYMMNFINAVSESREDILPSKLHKPGKKTSLDVIYRSAMIKPGLLKIIQHGSYTVQVLTAVSLCFILFTVVSEVRASDISLNSAVTPEKGTVGQPLSYTLSITGIDPEKMKIILPEKKVVYPEKNSGEKKTADGEKSPEESVPLYIINSASKDDTEVKGAKQVNIRILISYYRPGNYTLPEIKITGSDGTALGYKIPLVTIEEVNKEGALEDIEPPVSLSGDYSRLIWIIAGIVLIIAAALLLYRFYKKRKKSVPIEVPALQPIEIFLGEVESLKLRDLIKSGKINQYVFGISIIFRRYLSMVLAFDAAEMTTDEISLNLKKYMSQELYLLCGEEIISTMRLWDFSKFAEFTPSVELLIENLDATVSSAKKISEILGRTETVRGDDGTLRI